ncbi:hypothetical protein O181_002439 [Austropuccinia psidii MF-1]|uniref:Uncharacterized protein n=1 Tax=Austropuccinia psidii MF-1 TaxID=1389203 RepID=A0A9Q3BCF0_9BASI|nr:hypothetical protein [Austropuccinia psidii MF-1]
MELIDYMDGLSINVPIITDSFIRARMNTELRGHASTWYTQMKEIHGRRNWPWWKIKTIQIYINGKWICQRTISFKLYKYSVEKDPYNWCIKQSKRLKAIDTHMNIQIRNNKLLIQF